jgi:sensor histidine kinase regulating citrate/malate metabolism
MEDISLHILDIVENSYTADCTHVAITITEDIPNDLLIVEINDNGSGMDEETLKQAQDPFYSSKPGKKVGLGIPLLAQSSREGGGTFTIESRANQGTSIRATFIMSHPDTKPLGDVEGTVRMLEITHPEISFDYKFVRKGAVYET